MMIKFIFKLGMFILVLISTVLTTSLTFAKTTDKHSNDSNFEDVQLGCMECHRDASTQADENNSENVNNDYES